MSVAAALLLLATSVALLMGAIVTIRFVGTRFSWVPEVSRKAVHVAIGVYAMLLPVLFDRAWPVVALLLIALALMAWLRLPHVRTTGLGATIHAVERRSAGDIWLALAIGFIFLRSGREYIYYGLPLAIITLSDTAAALTGSSYGRRRFTVEDGVKSWEGVIAFFMVSLIVAMIMLLLLTDAPRLNVILLALAIAAFGAVVEALSWRGLDNLFVPVCVHFFLKGLLFAPPLTLVAVAALFLAAVIGVALVARHMGWSVHASRAFLVAIFLFLGVGGVYGAAVSAIAMAAHLVARRRPCASEHRDLDFIATLCAVGLIWFFIGESIGASALTLFSLGVIGLALGLLLVGTPARTVAMLGITLAAGLAYLALLRLAPDYATWVRHLPALVIGSFGLVLIVVAARRRWFDRWRAPRLALLANLVPVSAYLLQAGLR